MKDDLRDLISAGGVVQPQLKTLPSTIERSEIVAIYCDGGLVGRNPSPIGGTWAFCGVNKDGVRVIEESGFVASTETRLITNNHMEQIAIVKALEAMPEGWRGDLYSDSYVAIQRVFHSGSRTNLPNGIIQRSIAAVKRAGRIYPIHLKGHPTKRDLANGETKSGKKISIHQLWCDRECSRLAREKKEELTNETR